jgi:hypothetical protein
MSLKQYLNESKITVYHGDNYGTKKLDPKLMNNGNNQEGIGIYFGDYETAEKYGKFIVEAEINPKMFMDSRALISKYLSEQQIVKLLMSLPEGIGWKRKNKDDLYGLVTDYGVEVYEPEDLKSYHVHEAAELMKDEEVRNFQIILAETFGVERFVEKWNDIFPRRHGTYSKENNFYAIINTRIKVKQIEVK